MQVHCIAWAKYLFELLFGPEHESNLLSDFKSEIEGAGEVDGLASRQKDVSYARRFARRVFEFAFDAEIRKQTEMKENEAERTAPR